MAGRTTKMAGTIRDGTRYELTITGNFGPDELDDIVHQIRLQRRVLVENETRTAPTEPPLGFLDNNIER